MTNGKTAVTEKPGIPAAMQQFFKDTAVGEVQTGGFVEGGASPYIWFPHQQSNMWPQAMRENPGLSPTTVCLVTGRKILPLRPFNCMLLSFQYFLVQEDGKGNSVKCWKKPPTGGQLPDLKEWAECIILTFNGPEAVLARCRFSKTKSGVAKDMSAEIEHSKTSDWAKDPRAKIALSIPDERFRIVGEVELSHRVSRSNGNDYYPANVSCRPISADELLMVKALAESPEYPNTLKAIKRDYAFAIGDLEKKLQKE